MNKEDYEKLEEIQRLLDEAYDHYFKYESHAKSYEGKIAVHFNNYWDRRKDSPGLKIDHIEISSYVFCRQGRHEYFDTVDEALAAVQEWHKDEMAYDYQSDEAVAMRQEMDDIAAEFINNMNEQGKLQVYLLGNEEE
jgi:hypothetical protein